MKAMFVSFGAVLFAALTVTTADAQNFGRCIPQAPDCCGPGYYAPNWFGAYYGPNYNVYPGYGPYSGPVDYPRFTIQPNGQFGLAGAGAAVAPPLSFPTHPYARGPRDFFMVDEESARPAVPSGYGYSTPLAPQPYLAPSVAPLTPPLAFGRCLFIFILFVGDHFKDHIHFRFQRRNPLGVGLIVSVGQGRGACHRQIEHSRIHVT